MKTLIIILTIASLITIGQLILAGKKKETETVQAESIPTAMSVNGEWVDIEVMERF